MIFFNIKLLSRLLYYLDTSIGLKINKESYHAIAKDLNVAESDILFLTDNILECVAARDAGVCSVNLSRPGNAPVDVSHLEDFAKIPDFNKLL